MDGQNASTRSCRSFNTFYPLRKAFSFNMIKLCFLTQIYNRTLADLHEGHQGTEKMQLLTQAKIYWPSINADIANYVRRCTPCTKHNAAQLVQPMLSWDIPEGLWKDIASIYFTHNLRNICSSMTPLVSTHWYTKPHLKQPSPSLRSFKISSHNMEPKHIFTDNGPPSCLKIWPDLCRNNRLTTSHHCLCILVPVVLLGGRWTPSRLPKHNTGSRYPLVTSILPTKSPFYPYQTPHAIPPWKSYTTRPLQPIDQEAV